MYSKIAGNPIFFLSYLTPILLKAAVFAESAALLHCARYYLPRNGGGRGNRRAWQLWQTVGLWSLLLAIPIILFDTTLQAL
jgi:hypothetical protein